MSPEPSEPRRPPGRARFGTREDLRPRGDVTSRAILENLHDHLLVVGAIRDADGRVTDWRCLEADARMTGWFALARDAGANRAIGPEALVRVAQVEPLWREALATGRPSDHALQHEGREFLVRVFRIDEGTVGSAAIDVTDLRRAEHTVRSNEARFRALIEKSVDMIALVDADRRLAYWSPGATAVLGWTGEEMVGREFASIVHPDDLATVAATLASLGAEKDRVVKAVARVRDKAGAWHLVEGVTRNLLDDPDLRGIVINAHDVTRERELELQFRQAQRLESVGRLAGGVAHDFNNLLTVILNCAGFLEQERRSGQTANPEYIEHIRAAGERAADLTRQLLAFARKQVLAPVALDLNEVVRASEKLLRRVLGEDVELEVRTEAGLWPVVCDRGQVEQALMNLVVNARDALPDGGRLEIETRSAGQDAGGGPPDPTELPGQWVQLIVRDNGSGMSDETKAHLFEPFYTTKEQGKGTGLGLATVHGIVSQSGGHVRVDSERGRGTRFVLSFPRATGPVAVAPPVPESATGGGDESILVIEDDALVRGVTCAILRRGGYRVLEARSGHEAVELARAHGTPVALVVTDVVMPGMNGPEVVAKLRADHPRLQALYVSGYLENSNALRAALASEYEFLAKPFAIPVLLARVRALLDAAARPAG
jgi:PAS domain S-box-containing protein